MDLIELRIINRLTVAQCAQLFEVSQRTWRRWEKRKPSPPRAVVLCLEYRVGTLDQFGFEGWTIAQGKIINAQGIAFTPGEIDAIPWNDQLIKAYQKDARDQDKINTLTTARNDPDNVLNELKYEID